MKMQVVKKDNKYYGKLPDTGWIDMSSYINTENFAARPGMPPQVRKIGNVIYWRGEVYCIKAVSSTQAQILKNIPSRYKPTIQVSGGSMQFGNQKVYNMFLDPNVSAIYVKTSDSSIAVAQHYGGFALDCISGYTTD